jgi:hypothetical protein
MSSAAPFVILQGTPNDRESHPHEDCFGARELEARLRATVRGEVRFDQASRALYSTDASNYRPGPNRSGCPEGRGRRRRGNCRVP